ncbi:hypothetical protein NHX12_033530 [Muraenolepis orangiensis]|uniref:tRNA:m(4)X modification enzyme TRM13 n=1 Tax=Muraenolepis orangiensis TaxID=630683 RepID=A0A9Q0E3K0_9TELE|nr:hypothetical protein NHX12_033530 [Muraenolepis orangiensis]
METQDEEYHVHLIQNNLALRCLFEGVNPSLSSETEPPSKRARHQEGPPAPPIHQEDPPAPPRHQEDPPAPPIHQEDPPAPPRHQEDPTAPPIHQEDPPAPPRHQEDPTSAGLAPPSLEPAPPSRMDVCGLAIALCCHHRCEWRHYVGKQFFREMGLGASEFSTFQRMSSWATCDGCPDDQTKDPAPDGEHEPADEDNFNG